MKYWCLVISLMVLAESNEQAYPGYGGGGGGGHVGGGYAGGGYRVGGGYGGGVYGGGGGYGGSSSGGGGGYGGDGHSEDTENFWALHFQFDDNDLECIGDDVCERIFTNAFPFPEVLDPPPTAAGMTAEAMQKAVADMDIKSAMEAMMAGMQSTAQNSEHSAHRGHAKPKFRSKNEATITEKCSGEDIGSVSFECNLCDVSINEKRYFVYDMTIVPGFAGTGPFFLCTVSVDGDRFMLSCPIFAPEPDLEFQFDQGTLTAEAIISRPVSLLFNVQDGSFIDYQPPTGSSSFGDLGAWYPAEPVGAQNWDCIFEFDTKFGKFDLETKIVLELTPECDTKPNDITGIQITASNPKKMKTRRVKSKDDWNFDVSEMQSLFATGQSGSRHRTFPFDLDFNVLLDVEKSESVSKPINYPPQQPIYYPPQQPIYYPPQQPIYYQPQPQQYAYPQQKPHQQKQQQQHVYSQQKPHQQPYQQQQQYVYPQQQQQHVYHQQQPQPQQQYLYPQQTQYIFPRKQSHYGGYPQNTQPKTTQSYYTIPNYGHSQHAKDGQRLK